MKKLDKQFGNSFNLSFFEFFIEQPLGSKEVETILSKIFEVAEVQVVPKDIFYDHLAAGDTKFRVGYEIHKDDGEFKTFLEVDLFLDKQHKNIVTLVQDMIAECPTRIAVADYTSEFSEDFLCMHPNGVIYFVLSIETDHGLSWKYRSSKAPLFYKEFLDIHPPDVYL